MLVSTCLKIRVSRFVHALWPALTICYPSPLCWRSFLPPLEEVAEGDFPLQSQVKEQIEIAPGALVQREMSPLIRC